MLANMDYRTYLMEKEEAEYSREQEAERLERERAEEYEACRLADLAELAEETGCTPAEIAAAPLPRIETRPIQFAPTAQGQLFGKEVA